MSLALLDHALDICAKHLDASNARNTEIAAYLTRYLVTLVCAVFEEEFEKIIARRVLLVNDQHLANFVIAATHQLLRSPKISELSGFLGKFGAECKESFSTKITNTTAHQAFDTIVQNRHTAGHQGGTALQITFTELTQLLKDSRGILDAFAE